MKFLSGKKINQWLPQSVIIVGLGIAYSLTIAPGLSWANNGSDGGDLISAAATGGVAHPTGYPTYLMIARFFQFIPIGSIAFRTNLLSLIFAVLAALLIYQFLIELLPGQTHNNWLPGMIAAIAFGLSPLLWSQAVITEIYTLQSFFEILILYLLFSRKKFFVDHPKSLNLFVGLVFGLAMGNHLTTLFLLPLVFTVGIVDRQENLISLDSKSINRQSKWVLDWPTFLFRCLGILIGSLVYISLYFRAQAGSPDNWGNPVTMKNFLWLVTGKLYASNLLSFPQGYFALKLRVWVELIIKQMGVFGLLLGIFSLPFLREVSLKFSLSTIYLVVVYSLFSFVYTTDDSFVYLIFVFLVFSLWMGVGVAKLLEFTSKIQPWLAGILGLALIIFLVGQGIKISAMVDASKNNDAVVFGEKVMAIAPHQALVFTDGGKDSFTLWYYEYVLKRRVDIAVIVTNLLPYDWYRSTLRITYPTLSIPEKSTESWESSIITGNKGRPVCETIVVEEGQIRCWK